MTIVMLSPLVFVGGGAVIYFILLPMLAHASAEALVPGLFLISLVTVAIVGVLIMSICKWHAADVEEKLVSSDKEPVFEINDLGISCSIALLEGVQRRRLAKERMPRFALTWDQVLFIRFIPGRGAKFMKICATEPNGAYYLVNREKFFRREQHIVDVLRAHEIDVQVEDDLH